MRTAKIKEDHNDKATDLHSDKKVLDPIPNKSMEHLPDPDIHKKLFSLNFLKCLFHIFQIDK